MVPSKNQDNPNPHDNREIPVMDSVKEFKQL